MDTFRELRFKRTQMYSSGACTPRRVYAICTVHMRASCDTLAGSIPLMCARPPYCPIVLSLPPTLGGIRVGSRCSGTLFCASPKPQVASCGSTPCRGRRCPRIQRECNRVRRSVASLYSFLSARRPRAPISAASPQSGNVAMSRRHRRGSGAPHLRLVS